MHTNFCECYRSIIAFVILPCIAMQAAVAQKVSYSQNELTPYTQVQTFVVGRVSSNIVVWKYIPSQETSQILAYDDNMQFKARKQANVFASGDAYQFNLINRQNSFDVIAQVFLKHKYYCQLASFDEYGNLLRPVVTLLSYKVQKNYEDYCQFAISDNKKYFLLTSNKLNTGHNEMQSTCYLYYCGDDVNNIAQKTFTMPYYDGCSLAFSPFNIDNAGSLLCAEYISQPNDTVAHVVLYKSLAKSVEYTSAVLDFTNIHLQNLNIKINNLNQQYIIYGLGCRCEKNAGINLNIEKPQGIFNWVLNEKLENCNPVTLYKFTTVNTSPGYSNQSLAAKDVIPLTDNSFTIALTSTAPFQPNVYDDIYDNYVYSNSNVNTQSLFTASNPQAYQPGALAADINADAPSNYYSTANYTTKAVKQTRQLAPITDNLFLMRVKNDDKIIWSQAVSSNHEENAFSYVDKYSLINQGSTLHFICKKILPKNKQSYEEIVVEPWGAVTINPIMIYNRNYEIFIDEGTQIDSHSMVFPCLYNNNSIAFAKIDLE